jgi:hypothetical protein
MSKLFDDLIGANVHSVHMNGEYLLFKTDRGDIAYEVEGDCCSHSYFHDFVGVDKLLANGPIISAGTVALADATEDTDGWDEPVIQCYGYEFVTEHEQWGPQTSVMSFRNESNGYYGGWMDRVAPSYMPPKIFDTPAISGEYFTTSSLEGGAA